MLGEIIMLNFIFFCSLILLNSFVTTYIFYVLVKHFKIIKNLRVITFHDEYMSFGYMFFAEDYDIEIIDIKNHKTLIKTSDKDVILIVYTNITTKLITFIHELYHWVERKLNLSSNEATASITEQLAFIFGPFSIIIGITLNFILHVLGINKLFVLEYENLWCNRYYKCKEWIEKCKNKVFLESIITTIFPWYYYIYTIWYLIKRNICFWLKNEFKFEVNEKVVEKAKKDIKNKVTIKFVDIRTNEVLLIINLKLRPEVILSRSIVEIVNDI